MVQSHNGILTNMFQPVAQTGCELVVEISHPATKAHHPVTHLKILQTILLYDTFLDRNNVSHKKNLLND